MTALKRTVAAEVTRGIATGQMYSEIARNIKAAAGIPLNRAKTIARTEAGRVQEQATFDAAQEAKAVGADVVKQWSSRRDTKTRDAHRMLDGQIREVDEPFTVDGREAMHPHGFGVARLDINCRCTMLTRARAALDDDTLKLLEERAQKHGLLAKDKDKTKKAQAQNVSEFKSKYLKAAETLENTGESGIIEEGKFRTTDDPMREVTGAGIESNPKEIKAILEDLGSAGVEVVYRQDDMAYSPGSSPGKPGQFIIAIEASYSAWLHEYQHFKDDKDDGFPGMRIFMDIERCKQREINAYNVEIELAKKLGRKDIVERLEALKVKEVSKYDEGTDED